MDPVQEIKAKLPIEELVGEYCALKKKGRNFVASCPFHNDTHPSFLISPDKGIAYCFPCQKGGDIFSFYQEIEGVDFRQALKDLAEKTGVDLPNDHVQMAGPKKDERERMRECLEAASLFYKKQYRESDKAKGYIAQRQLSAELVEEFAIGYAPDSFDATYTTLLKEGFSRSEIMGAGLGVQKELSQERIYDRFRDRLMFPIRDHQGYIIGFGGRTLGDNDAKYINSPDGPLYNKSVALFGLSHAREEMRKTKRVILVEGYFDVMAFHRIGIINVIAVSGTALTEQHVTLLKRNVEQVVLCLDRDDAGQAAAERAFLLCKPHDLDVRTIVIPSGKDPDECVNESPDALREIASGDVPSYLDALFADLKERGFEKRDIFKRIIPLLAVLPTAVEQEEFTEKAAVLLSTTVTALKDDLRRVQESSYQRSEEARHVSDVPYSSAEILFGMILLYPENLKRLTQLVPPTKEEEKVLFEALKNLEVFDGESIDPDDLQAEIREHAMVLKLFAEEHYGRWSLDLAGKEIKKMIQRVNVNLLKEKQKDLIEKIRNAKAQGDTSEEEILLNQYQKVLQLGRG